jgi:hypothetical protein
MSAYAPIEHAGYCARVSTERKVTKRWRATVCIERGTEFTRLKVETAPRKPVPNDFPSEEQAVLAAYDYARSLIDTGRV